MKTSNRIALVVALLVGLALQAAAAQGGSSVYDLPGEGVFPEGIAWDDASGRFFVGSAATGAIYRGDPATGTVETLVEGSEAMAGFSVIGMKVDDRGRLWVAGGMSGSVFVYDAETGEPLMTVTTPAAESTFLNDLVVADDGTVYVTDSNRPVLFRVAADASDGAEAEAWLDFDGTPFEYVDGFNANGIVLTPDGQYLLVVQSPTGQIYRIGTDTREVVEVDLGGEALTNGDGLVLDDTTLYVVRNADQQVAVVEMSDDYASGTVGDPIADDTFDYPTTAALAGDRLLVVNSQFDAMQGEPDLPFTVSDVPTATD